MIRRAVQADLPEIYQLICALEETAFPKEIFTWGYDAILADSSHLLGAAAPLCADRSDQQPKTNQRPPFLPAGRSDADARETDAADNRITKKVLTMCNLHDKNLFHL